jgi:hypothetical protein
VIALLAALVATVPDATWSQNIDVLGGSQRADLGATVYNGRLYIAGGYNGTSAIGSVVFAPLGGDGSIGAPNSTTALLNATGALGIAVLNNYLFAAGGNISEVDSAPVNGDGTLGAFTATNPLSRAPYGQGLIAAFGLLWAPGGAHVTGGASPTTSFFTEVSVGSFQAGGGVTWATSGGSTLPSPRTHHALATDGVYLFIAGGQSDTSGNGGLDEVRASLGSISDTWTTVGQLPTSRQDAAAFTSGGFLFVVGGISNLTPLSEVLQARILTGGTLGAWIHTAPLKTARHLHAAVTANGYAYVIGGFGNDYLSDVEYKKLSTPGPATRLAITGVPATANVGDCVGPLQFELRDETGAPTWADADITVAIQPITGGHGSTGASCTDSVNGARIAGGADAAQFYVKVGAAGAQSIAGAAAGLTGASATVTVPEPATFDPHTVNGWGCSSAPAGWLALLALLVAKRNRRVEA